MTIRRKFMKLKRKYKKKISKTRFGLAIREIKETYKVKTGKRVKTPMGKLFKFKKL